MKIYLREAKALLGGFDRFEIEAILRQSNQEADTMINYAWQVSPQQVPFVESINKKAGQECER